MAVRFYDGTIKYEGCVFDIYEHNGYHDSDFYAMCVNLETGKIDKVEYDTTRCAGNGDAWVDLTEANFRAFKRMTYLEQIKSDIGEDKERANEVANGRRVEVIKGRKFPIGTQGTVFWIGDDRYGKKTIGMKTDDGEKHFLSFWNVKVVNPEQYMHTAQELIKIRKKSRSECYLSGKKRFQW